MSTNDTTNRLCLLPPEILHNIISYLYGSHELTHPSARPAHPTTSPSHPLLELALTSQTLNAQVQAWAAHQLQSWSAITHHRALTAEQATKRKQENQRLHNAEVLILRLRGSPLTRDRKQPHPDDVLGFALKMQLQLPKTIRPHEPLTFLMQWSARRCVFCGKPTRRRAILVNHLNCCMRCDRAQWPAKITKTEAKEEFALHEWHLLGGRAQMEQRLEQKLKHKLKQKSRQWQLQQWQQLWQQQQRVWPVVRHGKCLSGGGEATMFARADVEAVAARVHGRRWREFLALRKARKEARRLAKSAGIEVPGASGSAQVPGAVPQAPVGVGSASDLD